MRKDGSRLSTAEYLGFRGTVEGLSLTDLLQMLHLSRKSLVVCVDLEGQLPGETGGAVYLCNGELVHATFRHLRGREALRTLLTLESGSVSTRPLSQPVVTTIDTRFDALLIDLMREIDEARRDGDEGLSAAGQSESAAVAAAGNFEHSPPHVPVTAQGLPSETMASGAGGAGSTSGHSGSADGSTNGDQGNRPPRRGFVLLLLFAVSLAAGLGVLAGYQWLSGDRAQPGLASAPQHSESPAARAPTADQPADRPAASAKGDQLRASGREAPAAPQPAAPAQEVPAAANQQAAVPAQEAPAPAGVPAAEPASTVRVSTVPVGLELFEADTGRSLGKTPVRIPLKTPEAVVRVRARAYGSLSRSFEISAESPDTLNLHSWALSKRHEAERRAVARRQRRAADTNGRARSRALPGTKAGSSRRLQTIDENTPTITMLDEDEPRVEPLGDAPANADDALE